MSHQAGDPFQNTDPGWGHCNCYVAVTLIPSWRVVFKRYREIHARCHDHPLPRLIFIMVFNMYVELAGGKLSEGVKEGITSRWKTLSSRSAFHLGWARLKELWTCIGTVSPWYPQGIGSRANWKGDQHTQQSKEGRWAAHYPFKGLPPLLKSCSKPRQTILIKTVQDFAKSSFLVGFSCKKAASSHQIPSSKTTENFMGTIMGDQPERSTQAHNRTLCVT